MSTPPKFKTLIVFLMLVLTVASCRKDSGLPKQSSKEYNEAVRIFYVGLAALQVGHDVQADSKLAQLTKLIPGEPAGWANWGVLALRQRNYDAAAERLEKARSLAPDNDQINYLIGLLESSRGRQNEAIAALRKAVELNPQNAIAIYQLAQEIERQAGENTEAEFQQLISKILESRPKNLAALLELARIAAKRGDANTLQSTVAKIANESSSWPDEVKQSLTTVQTAASSADPKSAATRIVFLRNVLVRVPQYRQDLSEIKPPPGEEATPFTHFVKLETPTFTPAAADQQLAFKSEPIPDFPKTEWSWIGAIPLGISGAPTIVVANAREVRVGNAASFPFPGGSSTAPTSESILAIDFNYDFKTDLVLAGEGGLRLMRQDDPNRFTDVTALAKLPATITSAKYFGAWAADIEADGDLDIVLGSEQGVPPVLRNNGDGTFLPINPFENVSGARSFAWADLDADGDPDAALIDGIGKLHLFSNPRQGQFAERQLPSTLQNVRALSVGDINGDGTLDLLMIQNDNQIIRLSDKNDGADWETATLANLSDARLSSEDTTQLRVADLDNNGGLDVVVATTQKPNQTSGGAVWLSGDNGSLKYLEASVGLARLFDTADLNADGRLDLIGLTGTGEATRAINQSSKNYHWQVVRPHAARVTGDQRINSFGIGGEMEVRAGLLLQKQPINGPLLHFGLGEQPSTDVVRIVWPNGTVRAEFDVKADQEIDTEQRLKGSCPFLFAYDGKEMKFVKDAVPWSSAIGLRINTLGTARVEATEEWYKIRGNQLAPRDGYYDLRITAELWETYYYDQLDLMVVDHPVGTDIFVDERFVIPPAKLAITTVGTPHKIAGAWDDTGKEVTDVVSSLDEKYLDTGRGRYQGVTRDHYIEVDLGDNVPTDRPLYLIAHGWMHPTDSSINVAISQGNNVPAKPLSLEIPDGKGGWKVAQANLGFPAGRKKISLIDLRNLFQPGSPHRIRLRTTLEVYWDCMEWAEGLPKTELKSLRLNPDSADLQFRGFSVVNKADESSPELPNYNQLASSKQIWRDLVGYYTRFGDVRKLLAHIDDRYVIMNAGDEMSFRFRAQPPPAEGWVRDFVIIGDGWIKDGDYNSTFSKTVLPLPYHAKHEYTTFPTTLENEYVYKQFPEDWQNYHTRYVTPDVFRNALRIQKQK